MFCIFVSASTATVIGFINRVCIKFGVKCKIKKEKRKCSSKKHLQILYRLQTYIAQS